MKSNEELNKEIERLNKIIEKQDKIIENQDKLIANQDKIIENLERDVKHGNNCDYQRAKEEAKFEMAIGTLKAIEGTLDEM